MKSLKIKKISLSALFTAVIAASAWISLPTPFGVNLAFTIFGVSLAAFVLGVKGGVACTITYILLGAVGIPVFSQFSAGVGVLVGASGGFLWGFLFVAIICGTARRVAEKGLKYLLIVISVLVCHAFGIIQFCLVTGNGVWAAFLIVSAPFLLKDIFVVYLAHMISKRIKQGG